jgi:hypothetical protein
MKFRYKNEVFMKRRYGMCCNRGEVNQGKSHPQVKTYLTEQDPENLSWIKN